MKKPFHSFGLHSIQGRLIAIALFFIVATAITLGMVGYRFTVDYETGRFHSHFSILAGYLAGNAELGVLLANSDILETLIASVLTVEDARNIEIRDNEGRVLARRTRTPAPAPAETLYVTAPVVSGVPFADHALFLERPVAQEVLGEVRIDYALVGLERLKRELALRYLLISLLLCVIPMGMYWALARSITSPLKDLVKVAGRVSKGNMDVRAAAGKFTETSALARALNDMLDALQQQRLQIEGTNAAIARQQVLAEVGKFSMTVAHEIKNPLAIIKGSVSVLRKPEPVEKEIKEQMIGYIDEEIRRINTLVEDFLLFARPGAVAINDVLVADFLANLFVRLRLFNECLNVATNVSVTTMEQTIPCDIALFERALHNVIRNAFESGDDQVQIDIEDDGEFLILMVKDNGPGFDPETLEQVFEPFFSTRAKGTGLGLAIAFEVMKTHNGSISARNRTSGGACVELRLPLAGEPVSRKP